MNRGDRREDMFEDDADRQSRQGCLIDEIHWGASIR